MMLLTITLFLSRHIYNHRSSSVVHLRYAASSTQGTRSDNQQTRGLFRAAASTGSTCAVARVPARDHPELPDHSSEEAVSVSGFVSLDTGARRFSLGPGDRRGGLAEPVR
jgi:hypothetical protein